jgi:DNA-binding MarR family transcriptional regulator
MDAEAVARIRAFNRYYTNLIGVLDRRILHSPWSLTEVRILYEISHQEGTNARRLKQAVSVDEGYLSRTIERLAAEGLIGRRRSASDGRVVHLRLTARGRKEMEKLEAVAGGEIQAIIDPLSKEEIAEVLSCMRRIEALLGGGGAK